MAGDAAGTARKLGKCRECRAEQAEGDVAQVQPDAGRVEPGAEASAWGESARQRQRVSAPPGGRQQCEHNCQRHRCKDCGGASICPHNRVRSKCKNCGGASICAHRRERSACKDCKCRRAELAAADAQP